MRRSRRNVVELSGAALAVTVSSTGAAPSWRERMRARFPVATQMARYAVVGGLGTAVNAAIFLVLRTWWDTMPANLVALVLSTAVSTEANRRFTFGGAMEHRWRSYVQSGGTVVFYAFYSSTVLLLLGAAVNDPAPWQQSIAVAAASVLGGIGRFLVLRNWVFEPGPHDRLEAPDR